ncbi:MAG: DUF3047 domain-containing protein [Candidatus Rokuibacteriota bacterium]
MGRHALIVGVVVVVLVAATASGFLFSRPDIGARATGTRHPSGNATRPETVLSTEATIEIPLTDRLPARLPVAGVPAGWHLKEFAGRANVELVRDDALALRLRSDRASFVLSRDVQIDVQSHPWLSWSWKIVRLPSGGDVRSASADDQAAQLYVAFPRWPAPQERSEVIGYVWDTTAPAAMQVPSVRAPNVRLIVVASGTAGLGRWQRFQRNVAADYVALFGREPTRAGKIGVMIDSNDTQSVAEALVADLRFAAGPREGTERPTSMLR